MAKNIYGGGSLTNANGLKFEQETDLITALSALNNYTVMGNTLFYEGNIIGTLAPKHDLYKLLLIPNGIDYTQYLSKKLLPDEAIYIPSQKTVYIFEKKFQNGPGSVDEKLQTCDFKKKQYKKLFTPLNITVEYIYILNDWFNKPQYQDVLDYIKSVGCSYYFNEVPLDCLNLPQ